MLVEGTSTAAAIAAGYSAKTANSMAAQLLARPDVAAALAEARAARAVRTNITADLVLQEIAALAFAKLSDFVSWGPDGVSLRDPAKLDTRAVAEVSETPTANGTTRRIKLHDKIAALDKLAKHLGLYAPERVELAGPNGGPIEVSDAHAKLADLVTRAARTPTDEGPRAANP